MKKIFLSIFIILSFTNLKAETELEYSAYLGGLQVANILYSAELNEDDWKIKTTITASGLVDVFVSFIFFAESNGKYINKSLISDSYNFSYEIKKNLCVNLIDYIEDFGKILSGNNLILNNKRSKWRKETGSQCNFCNEGKQNTNKLFL